MRTLMIISIFCFIKTESFGQRFLNLPAQQIKDSLSERGAYFSGKKYTIQGTPMLCFSYSTNSALQNGLLDAFYYLDDTDKCYAYTLFYTKMDVLDNLVTEFKSNQNLIKMTSNFGWVDDIHHYQIQVKIETTETFSITYINSKEPKK